MQFRLAFPFTFLILLAGILGSRWIYSALEGAALPPDAGSVAANAGTPEKHRATPVVRRNGHRSRAPASGKKSTSTRSHHSVHGSSVRHSSSRTVTRAQKAVPATSTAQPAATAAPVASPTAIPTATLPATPRASATPTSTALPTAQPTTGVVTLTNYYVASSTARSGQTVPVVYTIDNQTGSTERIMLGASIKSMRAGAWGAGAINDPAHDVVALVPPGVSTHMRYFTLPARLLPGSYDVGWGLRNASTGQTLAFLAANGALSVVR
jgi:hypothetical protein